MQRFLGTGKAKWRHLILIPLGIMAYVAAEGGDPRSLGCTTSMSKVVFISLEKSRKSLSRVTNWTGRFNESRKFASVESITRSGPFGARL